MSHVNLNLSWTHKFIAVWPPKINWAQPTPTITVMVSAAPTLLWSRVFFSESQSRRFIVRPCKINTTSYPHQRYKSWYRITILCYTKDRGKTVKNQGSQSGSKSLEYMVSVSVSNGIGQPCLLWNTWARSPSCFLGQLRFATVSFLGILWCPLQLSVTCKASTSASQHLPRKQTCMTEKTAFCIPVLISTRMRLNSPAK